MSDLEILKGQVEQLTAGWQERIEWRINISDGTEIRVNTLRHPSLLHELREAVGIARATAKSERGAPNKPGSRPPGDFTALYLIDDITQGAYRLLGQAFADAGVNTKPGMPAETVLAELVHALAVMDAHPELLREARARTSGWVKHSRLLLGHDAPRTILAETVCGNCGGALAVACDASTSVVCVGDMLSPPCGTEYDQGQWLALARAENFGGGVVRETSP